MGGAPLTVGGTGLAELCVRFCNFRRGDARVQKVVKFDVQKRWFL